MWSPGSGGLGRGRTVGQLVAEVFVLEDLAELRRTPVGHQELQAGLGAHAAVTVVAEDAGDAEPYVGGLLGRRRTRRGACRAWGWWTARRRPRGRSRRRARGGSTPTRAKSLISCTTSWLGWPVMAVLYLRGRLDSSGLPMKRSPSSWISGVGSMISSLAMPATGEPRMTRGTSPQASVVDRPMPSRRRQISGMSSTRIQCSWMFWRSVRSAESAGEVHGDLADDAQLLGGERTAVDPDAEHEVLVFELVRLKRCGLAAVDPGLALGVQAPPAETAVQVLAGDGVEALLGVDGLDTLADVQAVVFLLPGFVGVERRGAVNLPLAVRLGGRAGGACRALGGSGVRGRSG